MKQSLKILTSEVKLSALLPSTVWNTHYPLHSYCFVIVHKIVLMQPLAVEFVECTLCTGIKNMPVCISACLSLLHVPVPFSLSFSYHILFLSNVFQDQCCWNVLQLVLFCYLFMLVHSPPLPLSCLLIPTPPSPPPLLSNQFNLAPSLGQSRCAKTRGWGEEGDWRRRDHLWDIGLSSQPPPWRIARSFWDTLVTGLVLLNSTTS